MAPPTPNGTSGPPVSTQKKLNERFKLTNLPKFPFKLLTGRGPSRQASIPAGQLKPSPPAAQPRSLENTASDLYPSVAIDTVNGGQAPSELPSDLVRIDADKRDAITASTPQNTARGEQRTDANSRMQKVGETVTLAKMDELTMTAETVQLALSTSRAVPNDSHPQPTQPKEELNPSRPKSTDSEEIRRLRRELHEYRSQIAELQKRSEAQPRGLEGSNNLFSAADKSSESGIILACQELNAGLQQNATYIADCLLEDFGFRTSLTDLTNEQTAAMERASSRIGKDLMVSLSTLSAEYIPLLLQIAFQAYLASALFAAASSWTFEPGHHAFIYGIYDKLRSVESQAICGHWRTLVCDRSQSTPPESLVHEILTDLSDILVAAGCTAPQSDIISKVTSEFKPKITSLVELAAHLGKMLDGVISRDFEVFTAQPGDKFEGKTMEDTEGCHAEADEETVLCTTDLGLMKRIPLGPSLWEKGAKQTVTVLRAKVLLVSFLDMED